MQDCRGSLLKSSPKSDSNSVVLDTPAQTGRAVVCCWFLQMHCAKLSKGVQDWMIGYELVNRFAKNCFSELTETTC